MADNTLLDAGTDGDTISTDSLGGSPEVKVQRVKVQYGVDGSATDVSDSNPLPVDDAGGSLTVDNAGTFATQVDGDALTALQVIDNCIYVDDADWTDSTSSHALVGGLYQSTPQTVTDGDVAPFQIDVNGNLIEANSAAILTDTTGILADTAAIQTAIEILDNIVHVDDAAFTLGTSSGVMMMGFAGTQAVDANDAATLACDTDGALHISDGGNSITVDNGGTFATQATLQANSGVDIGDVDILSIAAGDNNIGNVDVVTLPALATGANVIGEVTLGAATTAAGDLAKAEDAAHTSGDVGVMALGVRDTSPAAVSGTDGDYEPFHVSDDGGVWVSPTPSHTGGASGFTSVDLDQTEEDVATGPCTVHYMYFWNTTAGPLWAQIFNTNTVTVGTTAPTLNFMIPANADSDGAGVTIPIPSGGLGFSTALTVAVTGASGTDATDPGAAAAGCFIIYKD